MRWKIVLIVAFLVVGYYWMNSFLYFSYEEMDWNHDGTTTLGEIMSASSYRGTTSIEGEIRCREIISLKEGTVNNFYCVRQPTRQ